MFRKQAFWFLVVVIGLCKADLGLSISDCVKDCKVFIRYDHNYLKYVLNNQIRVKQCILPSAKLLKNVVVGYHHDKEFHHQCSSPSAEFLIV